jgi:hypothetical protein
MLRLTGSRCIWTDEWNNVTNLKIKSGNKLTFSWNKKNITVIKPERALLIIEEEASA